MADENDYARGDGQQAYVVYRHEVLLFTAQNEGGHLIWSGTGELIYPDSRAQVRHEISSLIIPELGREGIIPAE